MTESANLEPCGLAIGLPIRRRTDPQSHAVEPVCFEWAISLVNQSYPINTGYTYIALPNDGNRGKARDEIVQEARRHKAKYLWFVDSDVAVPFYAARKLIYDLEQRPEFSVAGGIYCAKQDPPEPLVFRGNGQGCFWQWKKGEVFEVTGVATGCMMIRMDVFDRIEPPWFVDVDEFITEGEVTTRRNTDDLYFCKKVTDAGMKILADGGVLCIHWDTSTGRSYFLDSDSYPMRANGDKRA